MGQEMNTQLPSFKQTIGIIMVILIILLLSTISGGNNINNIGYGYGIN